MSLIKLLKTSQAIILDPEDPRAYYNRAIVCWSRDEFDKAIEDFSQAIILNPEDPRAYNNRGAAYGEIGEFDKAIEDFSQAIILNPEGILEPITIAVMLIAPKVSLIKLSKILAR